MRRGLSRANAPIQAVRHFLFAIRCFALRSISCLLGELVSVTAAAQDRPAAFVDAATVVPGLIVDARYAGAHNFVGRPIDGYQAPRCLLTRPAAEALAEVAKTSRTTVS